MIAAGRLYVYYRVRVGDKAAVVDAVRALHARWTASMPSLHCELLERHGHDAEHVTLMETYAGVPTALLRALEAEAVQALQRWLVGERHVEVFVPCA